MSNNYIFTADLYELVYYNAVILNQRVLYDIDFSSLFSQFRNFSARSPKSRISRTFLL